MTLTIVATVSVLAVLILVHELGHYVAARMFDIRVPRFSIGFGPRLVGFRRGETEYRIGLLPLGGYVKLAGMDELAVLEGGTEESEAEDPDRLYRSKSTAARAIVLGAGVAMNAALAVVLFAVVAFVWGAPDPSEPIVGDVVEEWLPEGAAALAAIPPGSRITRVAGREVSSMDDVSLELMGASAGRLTLEFADRPPVTIEIPADPGLRRRLPVAVAPREPVPAVVGEVVEGSPAARAGLAPGDRILAVASQPLEDWQRLVQVSEARPGQATPITVLRDGDTLELSITPAPTSTPAGIVGRMGIAPDRTGASTPRTRLGALDAAAWGLGQSWRVIALVADFFTGLVERRYSLLDIGGPVMIAELSGAAARAGAPVLLFFTALLSINLAVINLLPIPALDGGQLAMLGVEAVRGKPASEGTRRIVGRIGVTLVAAIMIWAVAADVVRLLGY